MVERKHYFQFTKLVDIYAYDEKSGNQSYVGYFYDINLLFIMRFGFSDAQNRIWFEARYASLVSRFKPWIEYNLQRCDVSKDRATSLYQLREDWWQEIVQRVQREFCLINCVRLFDIAERKTDVHVMEHLVPPDGFGVPSIMRVRFDSTINPTISADGPWARHAYWMRARLPNHGPVIGTAQESFYLGDFVNGLNVIARWRVKINVSHVPNWVVAYMAVLDNVEEDSE